MKRKPVVLVVGASRGLGLALAEEWCGRDWRVIATLRSPSETLEAVAKRYPDNLTIEHVDIADVASVHGLRARLDDQQLDVMFVNAGISKAIEDTPASAKEDDFIDMMLTNALGPARFIELFEDLVLSDGVIAVMSSRLGSIANNDSTRWQLYGSTKAALNMLMKTFANQHKDDPRALLLISPGWVRTELGGPEAALAIDESIPLVVKLVERNRGRAGLRFIDRHGEILPW